MKVDIYSASRHESDTQKFSDVAKEDGTGCRHDQQNKTLWEIREK